MARRPAHPSTPSHFRKQKDKSTGYWILGAIVAVCLILIYLFSRNPDRERLSQTKQKEQSVSSRKSDQERLSQTKEKEQSVSAKTTPRTVKMRQEHGVYYIPARINGQELEFVFDTGASGVLISQVEATLLWKQGKLTEEDILGKVQNFIADGSVVNNTAIILRSVEVAGVTLHDIEAYVSQNSTAPLLLGQSVMSRFGSFTLDYRNSTVTFR